jgi:putative transcriptional regulator
MSDHYLANQFLIAMPAMADPNFNQTVTYVCEHSEKGALGIVINRPMDMRLDEVFRQLNVESSDDELANRPVLQGGPVHQDRGFVLHEAAGDWDSSLLVSDSIRVTTSRDILAAMARGDGPQRSLVALGYAGWEAGQLESEVTENAWLTVPAEPEIIFKTPYQDRWEAAAKILGVDLNLLSSQAGHA